MKNNTFTWIVYIIIGLGLFGLASQLISNPGNLLRGLLMTVIIGLLVFSLLYFFIFRRKAASNEMKKYQQAVKQSKAKYKNNQNESSIIRNKKSTNRKLNRRVSHLRVIDGNKSKEKNRTTF